MAWVWIRNSVGLLLISSAPTLVSAGTLNVTMQPGNGVAMITTAGAFQDCTRRGIDGWTVSSCGWTTLEAGSHGDLIGVYCVQAWWGSGASMLTFRRAVDLKINVNVRNIDIIPQPPSQKVYCQ